MGSGEETARFAFEVDPSGVQSGSTAAVSSLEDLQDSLEADKQAVKDLQEAIRLLRGATSASAGTIDQMKTRLAAAKNTMAGTAAQIIKMDGSLVKTKKTIKGITAKSGGGLPEVISMTGRAPGPLGAMARSASGLSATLGSAGVAGAAIVAGAALAAIPIAVGAAIGALSKLALGFRDVRREEMIQLEGMTRIRYWWGSIPGKASDVQSAIDKVSDSTATSREKISEYAHELYRAGLRGGALESMLEATSMKFSIQGQAAADRFKGMAFGANMLGYSVKKMADTAKARLQDLNARQVIGFSVQIRKLKDNLPRLFDSVKIDGFLGGLRKVTALFSTSTITGQGLQSAIGRIFSIILGGSGKSGDVFKVMVQGMVLGMLRLSNTMKLLQIRWLQVKKGFRGMTGKELFGTGMTTAAIFEKALWGVFHASVGVTLAVGSVAAIMYGTWKAGSLLSGLLRAFAADTWNLVSGVSGAVSWVMNPIGALGNLAATVANSFRKNWSKGGKAIVQGIIDGIKSDFESAKNAIVELGGNLKKWFEGALGIRSPSRAFRVSARNIPRGAALGITDDQDKPRIAARNMVTPANITRAGQTGASIRGGNVIRVDVGGILIQTSADNVKDAMGDIESQVAAIFERASLQAGAA
jgi:hypothetical protein